MMNDLLNQKGTPRRLKLSLAYCQYRTFVLYCQEEKKGCPSPPVLAQPTAPVTFGKTFWLAPLRSSALTMGPGESDKNGCGQLAQVITSG